MTFKWNTEYDDWIYPPQVYDEKVAPHFQNFLLGITSIRRLKKAELDEMKGFVNGFLSSQGFLVSTIETAVFNAPKTPAHLPNAPSFFAREAMRRG
jgi:hypothetical protein